MQLMESGHYRMQTSSIDDEGIRTEMETFILDGMEAAIITFHIPAFWGMPAQAQTLRGVVRDGNFYMLNDNTRRMVNLTQTSPIVMTMGNVRFINSGMANINGRNLSFEEYSVDQTISIMGTSMHLERVQYFIDENQLVGKMEFYRGETPTFTTIHALDKNVRMDVFDIPVGYREVSFEGLFF